MIEHAGPAVLSTTLGVIHPYCFDHCIFDPRLSVIAIIYISGSFTMIIIRILRKGFLSSIYNKMRLYFHMYICSKDIIRLSWLNEPLLDIGAWSPDKIVMKIDATIGKIQKYNQ